MHDLKRELASVIAEAETGTEVVVTRHNRPVARLTRPDEEHLHRGSRFGNARIKPALKGKTAGRYLTLLQEDRRGGPE